MPAFCQDCNSTINEVQETIEGRQPCAVCGSLKRRYDESVSSGMVVGALMHTKGYAGGLSKTKGLRFESKDGDSFSVTLGRFVKFNQLVDHGADRYVKKVVDPVTGEILREVDEPLPEHRGRGSAKKRDPK